MVLRARITGAGTHVHRQSPHAPTRREDPRRTPTPRQHLSGGSRLRLRARQERLGRNPRGRRHRPKLRNEGRCPIDFRDERRTVVILASGESAGTTDLAPLAGWPVLAVSDGYRLWRECFAIYAADWRWWSHHHREKALALCKGDRWSQDSKACRDFDLRWIESVRSPGLSRQRGRLHTGQIGNSGAQAIGLAFTEYGARRFVLVGFDFCGSHFFGEHPKPMNITSPWDQLRAHMAPLAADLSREGCEVINCSPISALTYWPKRPLADALELTELRDQHRQVFRSLE